MADPVKISAFVVCLNEQVNIARCLSSLSWCDEIVVVDSGSTDRTLEICRGYNARIIERPWEGYLEQKRFAASQCSNEWVLFLDADEELSPELIDEIQTLRRDTSRLQLCAGYELSRVVFYWGRWWRVGGWYPEFRLRLFQNNLASWGGVNPHEKVVVQGKVGRLNAELRHYTYSDISHQVRSLNSHSSTSAKHLPIGKRNVSLSDLIFRPLIRFLKFYFFKQGYKEGKVGLIVAVLEAGGVFLKYSKLYELKEQAKDE